MAVRAQSFVGYRSRFSCLAVLQVICAAIVSAQQVPFVPITGPNAPKGSSFLFEDSHGGVWLGGNEGSEELHYFDGTRFVVPVTGSLPVGTISGMAEDSSGGMLFAYSSGVYHLFHNRFQKVWDGVESFGITKIASDVFLASVIRPGRSPQDQADLVRLTRVAEKWEAQAVMKSVPGVRYQADLLGNVLYPCDQGFCEIRIEDIKRWRIGMIVPVIRHRMPMRSSGLASMRDRFGCVWMRSSAETAYQCSTNSTPQVLPASVATVGEPSLSEMNDGSMVISSFDRLAIGRPGNFRVLTVANGYPSTGSQLVTRDGDIWLSNANGLFVFPSTACLEFWTERDGLDGNTWSILPSREAVRAISGDTVSVLAKDRKHWNPVVKIRGATSLLAGPGKTLFISSRSEGVVQINVNGRILRRSGPTQAMMLARAGDGGLWMSGSEISKVSSTRTRLTLDRVQVPNPQGGGTDMKSDREGGLWTCYSGGLIHKDSSGWHLLSEKDGLPRNRCLSFAFDNAGSIWFGYGGLSVIANPRGANFRIQKLKNEEVIARIPHFLGTDKMGRLWRGTPNGVYVADPSQALQGQWLYLSRADGLPGNDTNQRSFFNDTDGSVWFGIDNSVIHMFPPGDFVHPTHAPSVFVSGLSWNNGAFRMADLVDEIESDAEVIAHIGSLQMDRRSAMRFRYRLLPQQTSWKMERNVDVSLGRLSWGTHQFEVQARLGDGPWSAIAKKSFRVSKPLWLSTPALLLFLLTGSAAAAGGHRWQKRRKKRAATLLPSLSEWRFTVLSPELRSLEGTLLDGRFELRRIVARGGFATVWEGRDRQQTNRSCAVKIFRQELVDKSWMARRFQQEVSALTQIDHRNVIRIYGHGTAPNGAPYLVMEFIHGQTLRDALKEGRLSRQQTATYLRQTSCALAEIHAHGVCHRDVKPENLMIRGVADPGRELVLIDFSIAIVQDPDETIHGLSRAAGTLYYMAPEQAIGYANESSDIYSLAKIVIEMLTGQRLSTLLPDASIDLPERVRELLIALNLGLSRSSIELIAQALAFDPSRRPRRVDDFGARIAQDLEG